ncbi:choice-of-anchor D domain-containing protein [Candidatus Leptofilum sp.]|uniref:choice-of-anchor D domain-containing protein n=1 Tax=Candidatus Leptofilum sp. TaxID=3241576 RepID=UPI003B59186B
MTVNGTVWAPIGPSPMTGSTRQDNGLVTAIAVNPNDEDVIYIGTAGGGVWRTNDGGSNWIPLFDRQVALGIGSIAIDPADTDVIYVGTSTRVGFQPSAGLFRSSDGGATWISLGSGFPDGNVGNVTQFITQDINVIIIDPANSNILYIGTNNGLFTSTDGGFNWTRGTNGNGNARTLVLDPTSPTGNRILYAGITNIGIVQSTDGGTTWNQVLNAATPVVAAAVGPAPARFTKVLVDIAPPTSPPNPNGIQVLYASMTGSQGAPDPVGVFASTDQGTTWTQQTATNLPGNTQGGYSSHLAVDPASPGDGVNDILYCGSVGQARSTDSGNNFTTLNGLHADTQAWAFIPKTAPTPTVVLSGTDGGLASSTDNGANWTYHNAGGIQTGLFYNLDLKRDATASVSLGALQDNQIQTTIGAAAPSWLPVQGGDGWDVVYDGTIVSQVYCTSGFWNPAPCTRVFRSADDGATWPFANEITPWVAPPNPSASDAGCYLAPLAADPSNGGTLYVGGSQNVWQSQDSGANWRIVLPVAGVPRHITVSSDDGNNVAIAVGTQVFVSTNALAATVGGPAGVTFANITRNLPNRNILRLAFDPNDPTVLYAVLGGFNGVGAGQQGHVFRTTIAGTAWTDISPAVDVPFGALAVDGTTVPTTLYVGNDFGVLRSVDRGVTWTIVDDIHFPRVPVTDLVFQADAGVLRAATYGRGVFELMNPDGPAISVNPEKGLAFGTVCDVEYLNVTIYNVGQQDLVISSIQRILGSTAISVLAQPSTPVTIAPGEHLDFTVRFDPTSAGSHTAIVRIVSNDPVAPHVDLEVTGVVGAPSLELIVPHDGFLGYSCVGEFLDSSLIINNHGDCLGVINSITSSNPVFEVGSVSFFPLSVAPGASIEIPLRFRSNVFGLANTTISVFSDDPGGVQSVNVSATARKPRLVTIIPDAGDFGKSCLEEFVDRPLTLSNSGDCDLIISNIVSSSGDFIVANVHAYPLVIAPGDEIIILIRFQPTALGGRIGMITITSNDPTSPHEVQVSGFVGAGKLAITGSSHFGEVEYGTRALQHLTLVNVGDCDLTIKRAKLKKDKLGRCSNLCLLRTPFPVTLPPGASIDIVLQFYATCDCPCRRKLIIRSDDPRRPKRKIIVSGRTRPTLKAALYCWMAESVSSLLRTAANVPAAPRDDCID